MYDLAIVPLFRYSYVSKVPKNLSWYEEIFPHYDEQRFRQLVRCSRLQFELILKEISSHKVFNGKNSQKQFTVAFQLALVLFRLGSNGDGATIFKISCLFGVGDGGTIDRITARVFEAILSLESKYLRWPSSEERQVLAETTMDELPYCVAYTDGSEIELAEAPTLDRDVYLSRNKVFALKLQGTCDFTKSFRHIAIGYPGSVHDARIFNNCELGKNPSAYLTSPQWIAADSAYKLTSTVITPFRKNSTELTAASRKDFNRYFSTYRVRVEHMFGIMKEKLSSLKKLGIRITDVRSHEFACTWIRVCCILHNILLPFYDEQDLQYTNSRSNTTEECDEYGDDEDHDGQLKRRAIFELINEQ